MYQQWKETILKCLGHVEAVIDFGEDAEISDEISKAVKPKIQSVIDSITSHLNDERRGERLRDGAHIAIIGPPNAGKSSLLNRLGKKKF